MYYAARLAVMLALLILPRIALAQEDLDATQSGESAPVCSLTDIFKPGECWTDAVIKDTASMQVVPDYSAVNPGTKLGAWGKLFKRLDSGEVLELSTDPKWLPSGTRWRGLVGFDNESCTRPRWFEPLPQPYSPDFYFTPTECGYYSGQIGPYNPTIPPGRCPYYPRPRWGQPVPASTPAPCENWLVGIGCRGKLPALEEHFVVPCPTATATPAPSPTPKPTATAVIPPSPRPTPPPPPTATPESCKPRLMPDSTVVKVGDTTCIKFLLCPGTQRIGPVHYAWVIHDSEENRDFPLSFDLPDDGSLGPTVSFPRPGTYTFTATMRLTNGQVVTTDPVVITARR